MEEENISSETLNEIDNLREIGNLKRVEATLFVAGKFLSVQELVAITDINPILLNQALVKLSEKYDEHSAIEIINKNELWKMDVKPEFHKVTSRLATGSDEFTRAEQETLAVIAYKHPITQAKIIKMRGNKAYEHIKKFEQLGLVSSKKLSRTKELNLSNEFYDYFNVEERGILRASEVKKNNKDGSSGGGSEMGGEVDGESEEIGNRGGGGKEIKEEVGEK